MNDDITKYIESTISKLTKEQIHFYTNIIIELKNKNEPFEDKELYELFDKLTLYQELINNFDFKGDKKTTITFKRKYSYDNDGNVIFIDQEKINHLKTKKSQQIFIY